LLRYFSLLGGGAMSYGLTALSTHQPKMRGRKLPSRCSLWVRSGHSTAISPMSA